MDFTPIISGFFSFLMLLTILAFVLAMTLISKNSRHKRRWERFTGPQGPSDADQAILDDISRVAEKMERRLEALERILEADDPKWKERAR